MRVRVWALGGLLAAFGAAAFAAGLGIGDYTAWVDAALGGSDSGAGRLEAIGWSRDGKVALIENRDPGEAAPMEFLRLRVVDAVEDGVLFDRTVSIDPSDPSYTGAAEASSIVGQPDFLAFEDAVRAASIEPVASAADVAVVALTAARPLPFPFAYKGATVDASIVSAPVGTADDEAKLSYSVFIRSSTKGKKKITSGTEPAESIELLGYFRSPFEPRILAVFDIVSRGFEGDPTRSARFSGCFLESRFE